MAPSTQVSGGLGRTVNRVLAVGTATAVLFLAGCEEKSAPMAQSMQLRTSTPPEYYPCNALPEALAQADAIVREYGQYSQTAEAAFWAKRQERLINRAYECKK